MLLFAEICYFFSVANYKQLCFVYLYSLITFQYNNNLDTLLLTYEYSYMLYIHNYIATYTWPLLCIADYKLIAMV